MASRPDSNTMFLEDYIEHIATLPNEIKRNLELMRNLDNDGSKEIKSLDESERTFLTDVKKKGSRNTQATEDGGYDTMVEQIKAKRQKAQQIADEKVKIAEQMIADCDIYVDKLDVELAKFEEFLKTSGEFSTTAASAGEQVAVKLDDEWILSRVKAYNIQTGAYTVIDADDNTKNYSVPESQTVVLEGERIGKGEEVYAVYPDTTSFYPGIITSVPRRNMASGSPTLYCAVQFVDDFDDSGATPDRLVPANYIFRRTD